jgi:hypothetical protein
MSGFTLSQIREALRDAIEASVAAEVNVEAYPSAIEPPPPPSIVIHSAPDYIDYFVTFGENGLGAVRFEIEINPSAEGSDYESRWKTLDEFLSTGTGNASSVIDAILADGASLGLAGCNARVTDLSVDRDEVTATMTVEVHIPKVGAVV